MRTTIIILLLIIIAQSAYILYDFERESSAISHRGKVLRDSIESLRSQYDEVIRTKDSAAYKAFQEAQESAVRWEGIAKQSQRDLKNEINLHRVFTDSVRDSLLSRIK